MGVRRTLRLHIWRAGRAWPRSAVALAALAALVSAPALAVGAELQLRRQCRAPGPLVTLGDVADIYATDAEESAALAAIELFPAPAPGRQRVVRFREIQDLLLLRGINLAEHRFSGAAQTSVLGPLEPGRPEEPGLLPPAETRRSEPLLSNAPARLSRDGAASARPESQPRQHGPRTPRVAGALPEAAFVAAPACVVVAARSLPRGAVLQAEDCQVQGASPGQDGSECFQSLSEVVGRETTRAIAGGRAIDRQSVRQPLAVRRSEIITVYARGPGVRVRTLARAREDGSLGELIAVETLWDRKVYTARVCGIQEVEVPARLVQADGAAAQSAGRQMPDGAETGSTR